MLGVLRSFIIILCTLSVAFTLVLAGNEGEELSNVIVDHEPAVTEQLDLASEEITSDSVTASELQSTNITLVDDKDEDLTLEKRFNNGVEAYLDNDWENCIDEFEKAIKSYKKYTENLVGCRRKCRTKSNSMEPIFFEDIEDLHFYEKKVKETLCLMKCKKSMQSKDIHTNILPPLVALKYLERRPYEYLHICYYQMKRYQDAANAIFTFVNLHSKDEQSLKNLRFYVDLPGVVEDEIVNLEAEPYLEMFKAGVTAYNDENYPEVIEQLENSIKAYMKSENDCRFFCEGPFEQGWNPEFTLSIANHFTYQLRCKRSCSQVLNKINGERREDILADHYHYLQFAYFKIGKLKEACAAVASYLLFIPDDETVLRNKAYFLGLPEVEIEYFEPREEASSYFTRQVYELRILYYIQTTFN